MDGRQTMRASDRDRQEVVDRLRGAVQDGRLQMDEFRAVRHFGWRQADPAWSSDRRARPAGEGLIQPPGAPGLAQEHNARLALDDEPFSP
jgi:Domain of unknown function (DUF1707)